MRSGVFGQIALGDVLSISRKIGECQCLPVKDLKKTHRASAVLNIGLSSFAGCGQIYASLSLYKGPDVVIDLGRPTAILFLARIHGAGALVGLNALDRGRKCNVARIGLFHMWRSVQTISPLSAAGKAGVAAAAPRLDPYPTASWGPTYSRRFVRFSTIPG